MRTASEVLRSLEMRVARLEPKTASVITKAEIRGVHIFPNELIIYASTDDPKFEGDSKEF